MAATCSIGGAWSFPKAGIHPRVKPEGKLFRDHALAITSRSSPPPAAQAIARRTPAAVDVVLRRSHAGAGDIEMRPRRLVDKALQQLRSRDRAAMAATGIL